MLSLAAIPLVLSIAAPNLGPYSLEPWEKVRPTWSDPLMDSLRSGGSVTMFAERRLPDGALSGRDTIRAESVQTGRHWRSIWWYYQEDTTRHVNDYWLSPEGELDSLTEESFRHDSSTYWLQIGKKPIPGGEVGWTDYGPKRTSHLRIDSFYTFFDTRGRTIATRTVRRIQGPNATSQTPYDQFGGTRIDSITWSAEGKPVQWHRHDSSRSFTTEPFQVRHEVHELAWDGYHLVRDSIRTRSRSASGNTTSDSFAYVFEWDGPRILNTVDWDSAGRPIVRYAPHVTMWAWDSLGRMTRYREWGTETDLDSLIYGKGPWPERRLRFACANKEPFELDPVTYRTIPTKDVCTLKESVLYAYAVVGPSAVGARERLSARARVRHGALELAGLGRDAREAILLDPSGRILSRTEASNGTARLGLTSRSGIALWSILDHSGRRIASGSVVLP